MTPADREESYVREGDAEILRLKTHEERVQLEDNFLHRPEKRQSEKFSTTVPRDTEFREERQPESSSLAVPKDTESRDETQLGSRRKRQVENLSTSALDETVLRDEFDARSQPPPIDEKTDEKETLRKFVESERNEQAAKSKPTTESLQNESDQYPTQQILKKEKLANGVLPSNLADHDDKEHADTYKKPIDPAVEPSLLPQSTRECETIRSLMNVSHLEEERNRLATFQRDLLLTRFLVEEQRRLLNQASDTISLPGSLSMGTQTDRHRATQTDVLCMMRPEPRKVKSENDDSSDSDIDCLSSTRRISRRTVCIIGKDKGRHKIRTPIIEESESTEVLRHSSTVPLQRENRSSMLRLTNNRNKTKDVTVNAKIEKHDRVILRHSKYHKSTTDVSDLKNDQKKAHVSLRDGKKSVSYSNINDACVLTDKEVYTPRSLKSRMIARRLSASEPPKLGAHCISHKQQDAKERQKADTKDPCAAEWSKKVEEKQKRDDRHKLKHQKSVNEEKENVQPESKESDKDSPPDSQGDGKSDGQGREEGSPIPSAVGTGTLKLKSKNQQLMEKKSVFTIAYDDATTEHLGESSNGSTQE